MLPSTAIATTTSSGETITGTDTLVMYTYGGDATLDGKINIDNGIANNLTGWSNGDFNYDGKVNIDDYTRFIDAHIGTQARNLLRRGVGPLPRPGVRGARAGQPPHVAGPLVIAVAPRHRSRRNAKSV
jgi:hypothetical protein